MSQHNAGIHKLEHLSEAGLAEYNRTEQVPTKAAISTTQQVNTREKKTINGMEFVSVKGQLYRYYDVPTGKGGSTVRIKVENPEWLFVRDSGSHTLIDAEGQTHYIPNYFVHIVWKNKEGEEATRF
jgi:hypothetical protein